LEFLTISHGGDAPDDGTLWVAGRHIVGIVSNANHTFEFGPIPPMLSTSTGNGDGDGDKDVDVIDFAGFQACFTGSDVPFTDPSCWIFDMNRDRHVDSSDFKLFQLAYTGVGP
jgi:hypothetical protein